MNDIILNATVIALLIFIIILLSILFTVREKEALLPWKVIFTAVLLLLAAEIVRLLSITGWYTGPREVIGFFELIVVALFVYTLLVKLERLSENA